jgi:hypothetical protein
MVRGMGSPKAPKSPTPPPPVSASGAETALSNKQAQMQERNRFSFDKTLLASNAAPSNNGLKSTLG